MGVLQLFFTTGFSMFRTGLYCRWYCITIQCRISSEGYLCVFTNIYISELEVSVKVWCDGDVLCEVTSEGNSSAEGEQKRLVREKKEVTKFISIMQNTVNGHLEVTKHHTIVLHRLYFLRKIKKST